MSTKDKLIERFQSLPSDFTFDEMKRVMGYYGFTMMNPGVTSGSRTDFKKGDIHIKMHKPHPGKIVGRKTLKNIRDFINSIQNGKTEI
jgi:predicted RNA binding protein YcfA (HicA-like mRNA interferase family)